MKKTLLSLAAMLLLAGGASAQTAKSAAVYTDKVDATPVSVVKKAKAPMMKEEESKYVALGFTDEWLPDMGVCFYGIVTVG